MRDVGEAGVPGDARYRPVPKSRQQCKGALQAQFVDARGERRPGLLEKLLQVARRNILRASDRNDRQIRIGEMPADMGDCLFQARGADRASCLLTRVAVGAEQQPARS
jgi:hypothetical protein